MTALMRPVPSCALRWMLQRPADTLLLAALTTQPVEEAETFSSS